MKTLLALILLSSTTMAFADFTGRCVGVTAGDRIEVERGPRRVEVALAGIIAPEARERTGELARKVVEGAILNKPVQVVEKVTVKGTLHAVILTTDGANLNASLVNSGWATCDSKSSFSRPWEALERAAREKGKGLWAKSAAPTPTPTPRPLTDLEANPYGYIGGTHDMMRTVMNVRRAEVEQDERDRRREFARDDIFSGAPVSPEDRLEMEAEGMRLKEDRSFNNKMRSNGQFRKQYLDLMNHPWKLDEMPQRINIHTDSFGNTTGFIGGYGY